MNIPVSTYRIQFRPEFGFDSASEILQYLKELGISTIYASPVFKSRKASIHGYDIVDPAEINPELGGTEKFDILVRKTKELGLGWLQDIVPNHMAYDSENRYLMDILEKGIHSKYHGYFDIEWDHPYDNLKGRVLAPFLGEFYGTCLDRADIKLKFNKNGFSFSYFDFIFPLRIEDYLWVLKFDLHLLEQKVGRESGDFLSFSGIIHEFEKICAEDVPFDRDARISSAKASLEKLYYTSGQISTHLDSVLTHINGAEGQPATFCALDELLSRQNFRFSYWKVGNEELNYRRFFTINGLMCMRIEDRPIFDFVHMLIFRLAKENKLDGLRIDHLDGLYNPMEYLHRLKEVLPDIYVIAEKILDPFEALPDDMNLQGTTGYDFLNFNNGIFVDKENEKKFKNLYIHFTGMRTSYKELVAAKKRLFMGMHMAGDIDNLAHLLKKILGASRYGRDMTIYGLKRGIVEMMAQFPIYRTYVFAGHLSRHDEVYIKEAAARAKNNQPGLVYELDLIERTLLLYYGAETPDAERQEWEHFTNRFQQLSGALMAKGMEDTTFYIYNRLMSLNEVGGDPSIFGVTLKDFHEFNNFKLSKWRNSLNATGTHDTKRGEDVRARINVLSEMPEEWISALRVFSKANRKFKKAHNGNLAPEKNDEYLIYQVLLGAYPFSDTELPAFRLRIKEYIVKAIREAKVHTAWIKPDSAYEEACVNFVEAILDPERSPDFMKSFLAFQKKIAFFGVFNSLSQVLLKIASPGVPDFYQGTELWDFNLVDPDNRRLIDFKKRSDFLYGIKTRENDLVALVKELLAGKEDGRIKLFTIYRAIRARNEFMELFRNGDYMALEVKGRCSDHLIAFARKSQDACCVVIVPRFLSKIIGTGDLPLGRGVWQDTAITLPDGFSPELHNIFTGESINKGRTVDVADILNVFPLALLVGRS